MNQFQSLGRDSGRSDVSRPYASIWHAVVFQSLGRDSLRSDVVCVMRTHAGSDMFQSLGRDSGRSDVQSRDAYAWTQIGFNRSVAIRFGLTARCAPVSAAPAVFQSLGRDSGRSDRLLAPGTDTHLKPDFRLCAVSFESIRQENCRIWILNWDRFSRFPVPASGCRIAWFRRLPTWPAHANLSPY